MPQTGREHHAPRNHPAQSSNAANGSPRGRRRAPNGQAQRRRPGTSRPPRPSAGASRREAAERLDRELTAAETTSTAPPASFAAAGLPDDLVTTLARRGLTAPFAIQARTLPDALAGRDILGRARTGSGKTLAFGLPLLTRLIGTDRAPGRPQGLVLVPTRELAQQVTDALSPLGQPLGIKVTAVYGGTSITRQIGVLRRGVDLVVATPGRLVDLIERHECALDDVRITVLDEADHMADLGFMPAVTKLLDLTPSGGQRMLFSATLDSAVAELVTRYLDQPALHAVTPTTTSTGTADHRVFTLRAEDKLTITAMVAGRPGRSLLFVRTKHGADRLARQLRDAGVPTNALHGGLTQRARTRALAEFTDGQPRVLVATDVAARGIHVDDVDLVVHFDPPADGKDYLHRSGRTARAGASGTVLSLVGSEQLSALMKLHRGASITARIDDVQPGHTAVEDVASSGTPIVVPDRPSRNPSATAGAQPRRAQGNRAQGAGRDQGRDQSRDASRARQRAGTPRGGARRGGPEPARRRTAPRQAG